MPSRRKDSTLPTSEPSADPDEAISEILRPALHELLPELPGERRRGIGIELFTEPCLEASVEGWHLIPEPIRVLIRTNFNHYLERKSPRRQITGRDFCAILVKWLLRNEDWIAGLAHRSMPTPSSTPLDLITLDQAAALVRRSKDTLRRYAPEMPAPRVKGRGGKRSEWSYAEIRPWLETTFARKLPDAFPWDRFQP